MGHNPQDGCGRHPVLRMELVAARWSRSIPADEHGVLHVASEAEQRAAKVYEGITPLTVSDVADCVVWAVTRPGP